MNRNDGKTSPEIKNKRETCKHVTSENTALRLTSRFCLTFRLVW